MTGMSEMALALLRRWPSLLLAAILWLAGTVLLARVFTRRTFFDRYVTAATPEHLAAIRILTCAILLGSTLWENLASSALLPAGLRQPMGVMRVFYALPLGVDRLVGDAGALAASGWFTALILLFGMAGLATRITIPLGALCYLLFGGILRQYSWFYHQGIMPLYLLVVLSFTPCGDGLSVDRLLKIALRRPVPPAGTATAGYGWARYACWIAIALPYVESGLSKLRHGGLSWWDAHNLRPVFYAAALEPEKLNWSLGLRLTHVPDALIECLGIAALLIELAYGAVLFSRLARRVLPYAASCLHVGILFLQSILFYDMLLLQLVFLEWSTVRDTIGRVLPALRARIPQDVAPRPHSARKAGEGARFPLGVSAMAIASMLVWTFGIEFYPLTGWPMYSYRQLTTTIAYTRLYARDETGAVFRAYVSDAIPALAGTRALPALGMCAVAQDSDDIRLCRRLFSAAALAYNRAAPPGRRVVQFRLQKWSWDLRAFPTDPHCATMIRDTTFALAPNDPTWVTHHVIPPSLEPGAPACGKPRAATSARP